MSHQRDSKPAGQFNSVPSGGSGVPALEPGAICRLRTLFSPTPACRYVNRTCQRHTRELQLSLQREVARNPLALDYSGPMECISFDRELQPGAWG